jgi:tetratricopeptide (TPR) repeat protein
LKFFTRLEKMTDGFSWVHAEAAEPRQLADKVMTLMQDRNLFIGICTRKELAIAPIHLSAIPLFSRQIANNADLQWKTSDWIIQEIGLAKGRELEILLLIEDGVRKPGGLQGDVEYIPFERSTPEAAFGKIIEMITALSPKTTGALTVASAQTSPLPNKENEVASAHDSWMVPSVSWSREQYEFAMFHFILEKDEVGAKRIDDAFLARPEAQDPENVAVWKAHNHFFRLIFGKGGDLKTLNSLTFEFPNNSEVHEFHARALARFEKHLDAASEFEVAADKTESMEEKARLWGFAAVEYVTEEKLHEASIIVDKLRQALHSGGIDEVQFLKTLRRPLEVTKDQDLLIAISERLVDLSPDDFETRFSLAYMHSEAGNDDLSLNHYLKVPSSERGAMHWNNLGVQFDHFRLPGKAVQAFRKSEEMNETLAMANLGYKMLKVGLLSEAQAVCEKALAIKDNHKNVGQLLVKLKNVPAEEDASLEVIEKSKLKIDFIEDLAVLSVCLNRKQ